MWRISSGLIPHVDLQLFPPNYDNSIHLSLYAAFSRVGKLGRNCIFFYLVLWPIFWLGCLFFWNWAAGVACIFLRLVVCQLVHLLLFSPILKAVFSPLFNSLAHFLIGSFIFLELSWNGIFLILKWKADRPAAYILPGILVMEILKITPGT